MNRTRGERVFVVSVCWSADSVLFREDVCEEAEHVLHASSCWHSLGLFILCFVNRCFIVISSANMVVMWSFFQSVCLSLCEHDYGNGNEPILLKLGVMIEPTNQKNWQTFSGAPVPDTHFESLFHFHHHCGIGDFRRFISISHTVTANFLWNLATWLVQPR